MGIYTGWPRCTIIASSRTYGVHVIHAVGASKQPVGATILTSEDVASLPGSTVLLMHNLCCYVQLRCHSSSQGLEQHRQDVPYEDDREL
eukprot:5373457-Amphidinium_carterae.1